MKKNALLLSCLLASIGLVSCGGNEVSSGGSTTPVPGTSSTPSVTPSTPVPPVEKLVEKYNYSFNEAELLNTPALVGVAEGSGIVVSAGGVASTIIDKNFTPGHSANWTFNNAAYDQNVENFVIKTRVKAIKGESLEPTFVSSTRICYAGCLDIQMNYKNGELGGSGVKVYVAGGDQLGDSNDVALGGVGAALTIIPDTYYDEVIRATLNSDATYHLTVSIDGTKVLELPKMAFNIDKNSAVNIGAAQGSYINWDYLSLSEIVVA